MAATTCGDNTLIIGQPTRDAVNTAACSSNPACTELGPADCCDSALLGPRTNRKNTRQQLHDYILLMLGAPAIDIELDEQQIDLAIDHALQIYEDYAPRDFYNYYTFQTVPGKSVYEMPPEVGHIRNVFYKEQANFAFQSTDLGGAIPVEYFYPGGAYSSIQGGLIDPIQPIWGRMGEWTLYKQYEQMYSRISSNIGGWEWVDGHDNIKLYPIPCKPQMVIVHYLQKCRDWKCVNQAMQEGALALAQIMLGEIRSKYQNIPGVGGGTTLNGPDIIQRGLEAKKEWEQRLLDRYGDLPFISMD